MRDHDAFTTTNDANSVFVSRLPIIWSDQDLRIIFQDAFGQVNEARVITNSDSGESRRFGFVTFELEESKTKAVNVGHLKGKLDKQAVEDYNLDLEKQKEKLEQNSNEEEEEEADRELRQRKPLRRTFNIKIAQVDRNSYTLGRGRDTDGICHLYKRGICPRTAEECRFSHEGEGGTAIPGEGISRKKCFLFKRNKCKKGDQCEFLHIESQKTLAKPDTASLPPKPCFSWKKQGKCSKGDACMYFHDTSYSVSHKTDKRKSPKHNGDSKQEPKVHAKKAKLTSS